MSAAAPQAGFGPWRGLCFLLGALALVQADATDPGWALARFQRERVLPVARQAQARASQLAAAMQQALETRFGAGVGAWLTAQRRAGGGPQRPAE